MKLSICMMVKNEEKNLKKCLESLSVLRSKVKSELIIVDTGSDDNTVEIAKKYTDKVYIHKWFNDFSGMRNITINYSKGEWILIIDADEVLEDYTEILVFLESQYTNNYNVCNLTVKSIINDKENKYAIVTSPRIFKNDGYFHYEGKVHNEPRFKQPIITLNTTLIHTGYIETDKELMDKKFNRTSDMLITELRNDPENIYYSYQLSVSYSMHNDWKEALEQIEKTYDLLIKRNLNKNEYIYIYYQLVICNLQFNCISNYKKAEKYCIEGIDIEKDHIDLYFCLAKTYMFMKRYEDAISTYFKYVNLVDNYENLKIKFNALLEVYSFDKKDETFYDIVCAYYNLNDYENCAEYIKNIKNQKYLEKVNQIAIDSYIKQSRFDDLKIFYNHMSEILDREDLSNFIIKMESFSLTLKEDDYLKYITSFLGGNDTYCFLNKIRYKFKSKESNYGIFISEFIEKFSLSYQPSYFGDLLYFKMKINEDIYELLSDVMPNKIEEFIVYIANKYEDFSSIAYSYLVNNKSEGFSVLRVNKVLERFILVMDKLKQVEFNKTFMNYLNNGINYISTIYSKEVIDNNMIFDVKNEEDVFFIFMYKAMKIKNCNDREYISYLRKALEIYPFMKKGIEVLIDEFNNKFQEENKEFESYKTQIKHTIENLISNGDLDNSKVLVKEYEQIVKDDMDIVLFKSEIALKEIQMNDDLNTSKYKM